MTNWRESSVSLCRSTVGSHVQLLPADVQRSNVGTAKTSARAAQAASERTLRAPAREIERIEPCTVLGSPPIAWAEACLLLDERASGATTVERAGANPGAAGPTGRRNCGGQIVFLASMDGAYGLRQIQGARGQTLH